MTARATSRGWPIIRVGEEWVYEDTDEPCFGDDRRPCKRCGREPTPEGYDACIGKIEGAVAVCCGHGVREGWVTMTEDLEPKTEGSKDIKEK